MGCGVSKLSSSQVHRKLAENFESESQHKNDESIENNKISSSEIGVDGISQEKYLDKEFERPADKKTLNDNSIMESEEAFKENELDVAKDKQSPENNEQSLSENNEKSVSKSEEKSLNNEESKRDGREGDEQDKEERKEEATEKKAPAKLTPEQIEKKIEENCQKVKDKVESMMSEPVYSENGFATLEYRNSILDLGKLYYVLKLAPRKDYHRYKLKCVEIYLNSNFFEFMCPYIIDTLNERKYKTEEEPCVPKFFNSLKNSLSMLLNFSDASKEVCERLCRVEGLLASFKTSLEHFREDHFARPGTQMAPEDTLLKSILGCLHNFAMSGMCEGYLREHDFTSILLQYVDSRLSMCRLSSIATLADIVDEKESGLFQAKTSAVNFLTKILAKALKNESRKESGWSAWELGRTVGRLARNDTNKKMLVEKGTVPLLVQLARSEDVEEEAVALESLWVLTFDEDNKEKIFQEEGFMEVVVERYHNSRDKLIQKPVQGILWNLRELLASSEKYSDISQKMHVHGSPKKSRGKQKEGHVMISYQWDDQPLLTKVKEQLKGRGYPIWMDIDNMGGSTLQAMAEAVENASLVLVCMSRKYKDSPNCRAEAEYAFSKRKLIVPLVMEKGYRPDGWLGIILGAKLFFDFSGKYSFEVKLDGLQKELEQHLSGSADRDVVDTGPGQTAIVAHKSTSSYSSPHRPAANLDSVKKWEERDVKQWLHKHNLSGRELEKLTGREVAFLAAVKMEAPEFFYRTLETKLGLTDLLSIVNFKDAIDDLS